MELHGQISRVFASIIVRKYFINSRALYKVWVKNRFVVFSPEIFVRIKKGIISSYPMKGTIDATLPDAVQTLMNDGKEAAEHATIVDLIRNDLSIVASHVWVERYRYMDVLQTNRGPILQTSSEICGELPEDYKRQLGDILFSMLPAGSITGAPKKKTMQIIREAEGYERGFYTGITGYFDGDNMDSAVMIRFVEQEADGMYFDNDSGAAGFCGSYLLLARCHFCGCNGNKKLDLEGRRRGGSIGSIGRANSHRIITAGNRTDGRLYK